MIESYIRRHEAFLRTIIADAAIPARRLRSALEYSIFPGGKRIRPVLIYLLGALNQVDLAVLDVLAAAVELTHCYSLIHDDLPAMDDDDFRRGKLSCHKAFDEATAILVGDGLQALAIEVLLSYLTPIIPAHQLVQLSSVLVQASGMGGMVSGQSLDLSELAKPNLSEQALITIHQLKTGKLITACAEMVIAANAVDAHKAEAIRTYTSDLGLVFQMQDDYLDTYAATNALGKNRRSDSSNQKTTFATLYNQQDLAEKINALYAKLFATLHIFGAKAEALHAFTQQLQARTN